MTVALRHGGSPIIAPPALSKPLTRTGKRSGRISTIRDALFLRKLNELGSGGPAIGDALALVQQDPP